MQRFGSPATWSTFSTLSAIPDSNNRLVARPTPSQGDRVTHGKRG